MTAKLSEGWLIDTVTGASPSLACPHGPGDDAAVIEASEGRRVITVDALVEGVHFLRAHPPAALGWKTLAVNLSDVAAMGARPEAFVLTAAVPTGLPPAYWRALSRGLGECARWAGVALVGGDTVRSPGALSLTVTAWGRCDTEALLTRADGAVGDVLMVRGAIGRSAAGLARWVEQAEAVAGWGADRPVEDPLLQAHLCPTPPLDAGPTALRLGAHAGMDLSDGLATDLVRLARASEVDLLIDLERLPADATLAGVDAASRVAGGEDYGLVILAPPEREPSLVAAGFVTLGVAQPRAERGGPAVIWRRHGRPISLGATAFTHF